MGKRSKMQISKDERIKLVEGAIEMQSLLKDNFDILLSVDACIKIELKIIGNSCSCQLQRSLGALQKMAEDQNQVEV